MLNVFVSTIICILWHIFLLNVANYAFTFFSVHQPLGHHSRPDPRCGKRGMGRLIVCGPNGQIVTQMGEMVNGVIMSGRGVVYMDEGVGPQNQNQGFPYSTIPKAQWSVKEISCD